jgi:hypothetical protein
METLDPMAVRERAASNWTRHLPLQLNIVELLAVPVARSALMIRLFIAAYGNAICFESRRCTELNVARGCFGPVKQLAPR